MNRKPMAIVCLAIMLIKKYMDGRHHFQIKLNMPFNYLMQKSLFSIDIKNISHTTKWKKPIWKGYMLYDPKYMTFWKGETIEIAKGSVVAESWKRQWYEEVEQIEFSGQWKHSFWRWIHVIINGLGLTTAQSNNFSTWRWCKAIHTQ